MKINVTPISGEVDQELQNEKFNSVEKATSHSQSNPFQLEDVSPLVRGREAQPKLLTALFGGISNTMNLETNVVKYDELVDTLQLPAGKAFDAFGPDTQKDKALQRIYEVGSFGIRANVAPQDYVNKRIPGTDQLMDEAYLTGRMDQKLGRSWDAFKELQYASLLTGDTNLTFGGPMPQYNFYTDILGGARPAATSMDLAGTSDVWQNFEEQRELLVTDLEKTFNSMTQIIVICGKNFFNQRLAVEKQEGLARPIRGDLDMQSMAVPRDNFNSGGQFMYQNFTSDIDGLTYIHYGASILGTKMIPDDNAYMVPVGAETFMKEVYAPAQTRTYANTSAQELYAWVKEEERTGVTMYQESNLLPMLVWPQLIRHLTV